MLSEYELQRQRNIEENEATLRELGLLDLAPRPKGRQARTPRKRSAAPLVPTRSSARLQAIQAKAPQRRFSMQSDGDTDADSENASQGRVGEKWWE